MDAVAGLRLPAQAIRAEQSEQVPGRPRCLVQRRHRLVVLEQRDDLLHEGDRRVDIPEMENRIGVSAEDARD
ncbi:hypothetical protein GCM10027415_26510 [Humibacter ginsengisoli]